MYQKYYTDAIVLGSRERGEADRVYAVYTEEFGLLRARASGARLESSRMRYALQNYAHVKIGLVRGKHGWRIAGATALYSAPKGPSGRIFARIAALTSRLVAGEEENKYLFTTLTETHKALRIADDVRQSVIEILCVARILYALGYLSGEALETALFTHAQFETDTLHEAESIREALLLRINRAISETHL